MFIVFEGPDGSGKSTAAAAVVELLRGSGVEVVATREPGGSPTLGAVLREVLLHSGGDLGARAETLLFCAERAEHVRTVIAPALAGGAVVVCDRFVDSTLAYQSAGRGVPVEEVLAVSGFAQEGVEPDLVVVVDVDPQVSAARCAARDGAPDRMEAADLGGAARALFLSRAREQPHRYVVVDGSQPREVVAREIFAEISTRLAGRAGAA